MPEKVESLSWGENDRWWPVFWTEGGGIKLCFACGGTAERGSAFWRKEKAESCVWGNGRAIYRVLEKFYFAFMFFFLVFENFFFFFFFVFMVFSFINIVLT